MKQSIVHFEPASAPFSLVLLLDMSGSTLNFRPTLKQSALRFIDALGPDDRVEVVSFNDRVQTLQHFTTDRKKIGFAVVELAKGRGDTNLYQALDCQAMVIHQPHFDRYGATLSTLVPGMRLAVVDLHPICELPVLLAEAIDSAAHALKALRRLGLE